MKTAELIRRLQEADPSGELEVCIDNEDILGVDTCAAYFDGSLQVLERAGRDDYDIIGARYVSSGWKVDLQSHAICEAIWENPDLPVEFDHEETRAKYGQKVEQWREEARERRERRGVR